jgi:hypothetical protein
MRLGPICPVQFKKARPGDMQSANCGAAVKKCNAAEDGKRIAQTARDAGCCW